MNRSSFVAECALRVYRPESALQPRVHTVQRAGEEQALNSPSCLPALRLPEAQRKRLGYNESLLLLGSHCLQEIETVAVAWRKATLVSIQHSWFHTGAEPMAEEELVEPPKARCGQGPAPRTTCSEQGPGLGSPL